MRLGLQVANGECSSCDARPSSVADFRTCLVNAGGQAKPKELSGAPGEVDFTPLLHSNFTLRFTAWRSEVMEKKRDDEENGNQERRGPNLG